MVLGLVAGACGGGDDDGDDEGAGGDEEQQKIALVFDVGGRGDKSFNDEAVEGMEKAKKEFDLDVKELEPASGGENREELLTLVSGEGYPWILANGYAFTDSVVKLAPMYPNVKYVLTDAVPASPMPNVQSLTFTEEQGSYLMGVAAALKSKTAHIGFLGGVEGALIKKFEAGYVAGAKAAKPDIKIDVKYLTQEPDYNGFRDPARGKEAGLGMYAGGADVVYHAAGLSGTGLFEAVVESSAGGKQLWAIGVDTDQYQVATAEQKKHILTSMLKRVDNAVYASIKAFMDDEWEPGVQAFDLKSGGIDYSTSGGYVDDIKSQIDSYKQKIISGEIKVPTKP